jgi:hypothetical protein
MLEYFVKSDHISFHFIAGCGTQYGDRVTNVFIWMCTTDRMRFLKYLSSDKFSDTYSDVRLGDRCNVVLRNVYKMFTTDNTIKYLLSKTMTIKYPNIDPSVRCRETMSCYPQSVIKYLMSHQLTNKYLYIDVCGHTTDLLRILCYNKKNIAIEYLISDDVTSRYSVFNPCEALHILLQNRDIDKKPSLMGEVKKTGISNMLHIIKNQIDQNPETHNSNYIKQLRYAFKKYSQYME